MTGMLRIRTVSPPNDSTSSPSSARSSRWSRIAAASSAARWIGSGTSSPCDSTFPPATRSRELLVKDPLVERMLVDHHHAVAGLGDEIAVVNLDGLERCRAEAGLQALARCGRDHVGLTGRRPRRRRCPGGGAAPGDRGRAGELVEPVARPELEPAGQRPRPFRRLDPADGIGDRGGSPAACGLEPRGDRLSVGGPGRELIGRRARHHLARNPRGRSRSVALGRQGSRRACREAEPVGSEAGPAPPGAGNADRSPGTSGEASRAGGCRPAGDRGTGPRSWSDGRSRPLPRAESPGGGTPPGLRPTIRRPR